MLHHFELRLDLVHCFVLASVVTLDIAHHRVHALDLKLKLELLLVDRADLVDRILAASEHLKVRLRGIKSTPRSQFELTGLFEQNNSGLVAADLAIFFAQLDEGLFIFEEAGRHDVRLVLQMALLQVRGKEGPAQQAHAALVGGVAVILFETLNKLFVFWRLPLKNLVVKSFVQTVVVFGARRLVVDNFLKLLRRRHRNLVNLGLEFLVASDPISESVVAPYGVVVVLNESLVDICIRHVLIILDAFSLDPIRVCFGREFRLAKCLLILAKLALVCVVLIVAALALDPCPFQSPLSFIFLLLLLCKLELNLGDAPVVRLERLHPIHGVEDSLN